MCLFYKLSAERGWASRKKGKQKEKSLAFFGNHVDISVRICGFEAGNVADLRPDFGIFVDNKYWELPGSCMNLTILADTWTDLSVSPALADGHVISTSGTAHVQP